VPPEMIRAVKHLIDIPLIVGGGIRSKEQASVAASAGADVIVTGNVTESSDAKQRVSEIIKAIKCVKV
jgi:phosphoglycerol geranylgeranyltransferase